MTCSSVPTTVMERELCLECLGLRSGARRTPRTGKRRQRLCGPGCLSFSGYWRRCRMSTTIAKVSSVGEVAAGPLGGGNMGREVPLPNRLLSFTMATPVVISPLCPHQQVKMPPTPKSLNLSPIFEGYFRTGDFQAEDQQAPLEML